MKSNNKDKKAFVLRLNEEVYKKVGERADEIGISRNAYISMIIHKEVNKK